MGNLGRGGDGETLEAFARKHRIELVAVVPEDEAVIRADRVGACVLDQAPECEAVRTIGAVAEVVVGSVAPRPLP